MLQITKDIIIRQCDICRAAKHNNNRTFPMIKLVPYSITSIAHRADPGFLAVSLQVTSS